MWFVPSAGVTALQWVLEVIFNPEVLEVLLRLKDRAHVQLDFLLPGAWFRMDFLFRLADDHDPHKEAKV